MHPGLLENGVAQARYDQEPAVTEAMSRGTTHVTKGNKPQVRSLRREGLLCRILGITLC